MIELDQNQLNAVQTTEGPVLILAGPGSGKTTILINRISYLIREKNVKEHEILITTFTDKASKEIMFRLNEELKDKHLNLNKMYIGTMHSIWLKLIQEYIFYSNFYLNPQVLDAEEQHFFIYSKMKEFKQLKFFDEFKKEVKFYKDWDISGKLRDLFNKINEQGIDIKDIFSDKPLILFLKEAYNLYENFLFKENIIDFSYIQIEIYNLLIKNPHVLDKLSSKIKYIMIDEYQDTNKIQEKILLLIAEKYKNICVVGDEDQSIYRFRGATADNIIKFPNIYKECKIINLDTNYRSSHNIVEMCNSWIKSIDWGENRYNKNIYSNKGETIANTDLLSIKNIKSNLFIKKIVDFVISLKKSNKIEDYSQVVFLFETLRYEFKLEDLRIAFESKGIPVNSPRSGKFFQRYEIKLVIGIFLAIFFDKTDSIYNLNYYFDSLYISRIEAKNDNLLLEWIVSQRKKFTEKDFDIFYSLNEILYELFQFDYFKSIFDFENSDHLKIRARHNLSIFSKIILKLQNLTKIQQIDTENIDKLIKYFFTIHLPHLISKGLSEYENVESLPRGSVSFLTIHQSKGLEFPIVFTGFLNKQPQIKRNQNKTNIFDQLFLKPVSEYNEEQFDFYRQYYVAFSRPKHMLVLLAEKNISPFFNKSLDLSTDIESKDFNLDYLETINYNEVKEKPTISYTGDILLYKECSLKYYFMRILKFAPIEKGKEALYFGTLVHKTLEYMHRFILEYILENETNFINTFNETKESEINILLENNLESIIENSYSRFSESIGLEHDINVITKLKDVIYNYVQKNSTNFQKIYDVESKNQLIKEDYLLYGEIDLILKSNNININKTNKTINIIDFKTGKYKPNATQINNIYKKQLIFYKYLLQNSYSDYIIKTSLYYIEENIEIPIEITEEDIELEKTEIDEIVSYILNVNSHNAKYNEHMCGRCEFCKYYSDIKNLDIKDQDTKEQDIKDQELLENA